MDSHAPTTTRDVDRLVDVYRTMVTRSLIDLRHAFFLDRAATTNAATQAFCTGRIAAIDAVLHERGAI